MLHLAIPNRAGSFVSWLRQRTPRQSKRSNQGDKPTFVLSVKPKVFIRREDCCTVTLFNHTNEAGISECHRNISVSFHQIQNLR
jgi:hypothetical protein